MFIFIKQQKIMVNIPKPAVASVISFRVGGSAKRVATTAPIMNKKLKLTRTGALV